MVLGLSWFPKGTDCILRILCLRTTPTDKFAVWEKQAWYLVRPAVFRSLQVRSVPRTWKNGLAGPKLVRMLAISYQVSYQVSPKAAKKGLAGPKTKKKPLYGTRESRTQLEQGGPHECQAALAAAAYIK